MGGQKVKTAGLTWRRARVGAARDGTTLLHSAQTATELVVGGAKWIIGAEGMRWRGQSVERGRMPMSPQYGGRFGRS